MHKENNLSIHSLFFGMKDRLLVISLSDHMGGAEQCLRLIAAEAGCHLMFLKRSGSNSIQDIDVKKVSYMTTLPLICAFALLPFCLYKYRKQFTIISSHSYLNAVLGVLRRIGYLKGTLIARESTSIFTRYKGIKRASYKLAYWLGYPALGRIICQSELMSAQLLKNNSYLSSANVKVIPNPIDLVKAKNNADLERPHITDEYICAAGRLISIKGFGMLIEAFSLLVIERPYMKLVILGSGPSYDHLILLAEQLGIAQSVLLLGHKENPYPYFKYARLCVVPSIMEGFPNVLLQMMAVNPNVVSTLCAGGIAEIPLIVKVKTNDVQDLYKGLLTALGNITTGAATVLENYLAPRNPKSYLKEVLAGLDLE